MNIAGSMAILRKKDENVCIPAQSMNKTHHLLKIVCLIVLFSAFLQPSLGQNNHGDYKNLAVEQSEKYVSGNEFQKDFLLFMDMIAGTHPAFASQHTPLFDVDSVISEGYAHLNNCTAYYVFLSSLLHQVPEAHNPGSIEDYFWNKTEVEVETNFDFEVLMSFRKDFFTAEFLKSKDPFFKKVLTLP
jgi:hypothetical protein